MPILEQVSQYLQGQTLGTPLKVFVVNMVLTGLLCALLARFYVTCGSTVSNRRSLGRNFVLLGVTTMLVVTVVKSSLALSLGLVGALSIVRFRGAIKEPEELTYLFICIAIGLGFGARQGVLTSVALAGLLAFIFFQRRRKPDGLSEGSLFMVVSSEDPQQAGLKTMSEVLKKHCPSVNLRRFDESLERVEAFFVIEADDFEAIEKTKVELLGLSGSVQVSLLDNEGLF